MRKDASQRTPNRPIRDSKDDQQIQLNNQNVPNVVSQFPENNLSIDKKRSLENESNVPKTDNTKIDLTDKEQSYFEEKQMESLNSSNGRVKEDEPKPMSPDLPNKEKLNSRQSRNDDIRIDSWHHSQAVVED